jgi:hypothetical protein
MKLGMVACLSEIDAKQIAAKFLEQYHNNVIPKEITVENGIYLVTLVTGVVDKKTVQVKVDASTAHIVGISHPIDFTKIVDAIFEVDSEIRYVLIINSKGTYVHSKMATGKTNLVENEDQISNLSSDLYILRQLLKMFDKSFGKTTYIHFERERIHILIFYIKNLILCVSCERSLDGYQIMDVSNKIRLTIEGINEGF